MSVATLTGIFIAFFGALLLILVGVVGFFATAWMKEQARRDKKAEDRDAQLTLSIDGLKEAIWKLRDQFVLRKDYDRDMASLKQAAGHVVGRRMGEVLCPHEDCPFLTPPEPRSTWPEGVRLPNET